MRRLRTLAIALLGALAIPAIMVLAPTANAGMTIGHYNLIIDGRFDFHTWIWTIASCDPPNGVEECAVVSAIPQPIAKAYEWYGQAQRTGGTYTMTVRCAWPYHS